jgi:hypothetical protein
MVWTDEMRAKAAATRLATKQKKEAARLKREAKIAIVDLNIQDLEIPSEEALTKAIYETGLEAFDWETCPLTEAINKAADMKREYDRVSAIVLRRQNPNGRRWTCYTEEVRLTKGQVGKIPSSVLAQCLRTGEDGKWKFRDDGRFVLVNGVRTLKPAFCCNAFCYQLYQAARASQPR